MTKRKYTDEERWRVAARVDYGMSFQEASQRTGIAISTIKRWVRKLDEGKLPIPPSPKGTFSNPA